MTTAKSSFSFGRFWPVYRNTLRRFRGTGIFIGVMGLIAYPLQLLLTVIDHRENPNSDWVRYELIGPAQSFNAFTAVFFTALFLIVSLVLAVSLCSYMQNRRSTDVYHSLPIKRSELLLATTAAGMTLLWVPLIACFLLAGGVGIVAVPDFSPVAQLVEMLCWMAGTFAIFAITLFAAVQVGTVFDTAIFSLVLNGALPAVTLLMTALASGFLYGFNGNDIDLMELSYRLSPVSLVIGRMVIASDDLERITQNNISCLLWFLAGIVLLAAAVWLYMRRKSEQAEQIGNLGPLQIFVRAVGTLLAGSLMGAMCAAVLPFAQEKVALLICIGIGSLVSYFIGDVILTRSVRSLPKALPVALVTTLGCCLLVSSVMFGGFGFETRVPNVQDVASVELINYRGRRIGGRYSSHSVVLETPEAVALMVRAHQAQVTEWRANPEKDANIRTSNMTFVYTLKSGRTMQRRYYDVYPGVADALISLEANPELIRKTSPLMSVNAQEIREVDTYNILGSKGGELRLTRDQKAQLLAAMQADLLAQPESELRNGAIGLGYLSIELPIPMEDRERQGATMEFGRDTDNTFYTEQLITASFTRTLAMLDSIGEGDRMKNDFAQVDAAYIGMNPHSIDGAVTRTVRGDALDIGSELQNNREKQPYGNPSSAYVELSLHELEMITPKLMNIASDPSTLVYVAVHAAGDTSDETITGSFLVSIKSLPQEIQARVIDAGVIHYGDWVKNALVNEGLLSADSLSSSDAPAERTVTVTMID